MADSIQLRAALWYLKELHWPVVPIHYFKGGKCSCYKTDCPFPAKHPVISWGGRELNPDCLREESVREWWRDEPYNVGVAAGPASGLLFVDFDPKNGGTGTHEKLLSTRGVFPQTLTFDTGGGGFQYAFQYPGGYIGNFAPLSRDLPGMDIRAYGGLSVVPPSVHKSGKPYKWREGLTPATSHLAPLPAWFHELILTHCGGTGDGAKAYIDRAIMPDEGMRNNYLSSWITSLRNLYPREQVEPLGLILAQALEQGEDWLHTSMDRVYSMPAIRPSRSQYERELLSKTAEEKRLHLLDLKQAWNPERPKPKYLIEDFLAERDICAIVAPPEMGKSLIALHLAIAVASGKPAFGRYLVPQRQRVLYVNAENPDGLSLDRVRDIANGMGVKPEDLDGWLFFSKEGRLDLASGTPDNVMIEEMIQTHDIRLVVLDSLVSFLKGDHKVAGAVRDWFDTTVRAWRATYNCATIVLHHSRKPDREFSWDKASDSAIMDSARDSSDIPAGVERFLAINKIKEDEDVWGPEIRVKVRMAKARGGDKLAPFTIEATNPEEHNTVLSVLSTSPQGKSALVQTYVSIFLGPNECPLGDLIAALTKELRCDEKRAYKWVDKLQKRKFLILSERSEDRTKRVKLL